MEYAVVEIKGKQYLVRPGDSFAVDGEMTDKDLTGEIKVLLTKDKKVKIGKPQLTTKVGLKVVEVKKSKKIRVATYRSKSRYRRVKGHRQLHTIVEWPKAGGAAKKVAAKPAAKTASTKATAKKPTKTTKTPKKAAPKAADKTKTAKK